MNEATPPSRDAIYAALENVYDPELDESLVRLEFIDTVEIEGDHVTVRYKVPTFWCAPNFTYMMSADIRAEVSKVPGVRVVTVLVRNNCAEEEINRGVNAGLSFEESFPDDAMDGGLDELRRKFAEKGFLARQDVLLRRMRALSLGDDALLALRIAALTPDGEDVLVQLPGGAQQRVRLAADDLRKYLRRRTLLGLGAERSDLLFTTIDGTPLSEVDLTTYLRQSRGARLNIAFNTTLCEGLLRATYMPERVGDATSVGDSLLVPLAAPA